MTITRRGATALLGSLASLVACRRAAWADTPLTDGRTITIVVPAVAGGATDIIARIISKSLGESLKTSVIVENKGGANGNLGGAYVARSAPDGHTLLLAPTNNLVTNQFTTLNMGYDPAVDLTPVALVAEAPEMIATPASFPPKTLAEFVEAVRAKPGEYSYGSPGVGSVPHLSVERLLRVMKLKMTHVPYRGAAAAMNDIAAGRIQMTMATLASIAPFSESGAARILAVAGATRLKSLPDVPTLAEAGWNDQEMSNWWGICGPKGMSPETIALLNARLRAAFEDPETVETLAKIGIVARSETTEAFNGYLAKELTSWAAIIKDVGLKPQ